MGNRRLFLILALGFVSMLLWQAWQQDYGPKLVEVPARAVPAQAATAPPPDNQADKELPSLPQNSSLQAISPTAAGATSLPVPSATNGYIHVVTDKLDILVDTRGGEISGVALRAYPIALDKPDEPFPLLKKTASHYYVAQSGLLSRQQAPDHLAPFKAEKSEYFLGNDEAEIRVPLLWEDGNGIRVEKTLIFKRGTHVIDLHYHIENHSALAWQGRQYRQLVRTSPGERSGMDLVMYTFNGAAYYSAEDKFEKIQLDDIAGDPLSKDVKGGWTGMIQHYFLSAWIPDSSETNNFYTRTIRGGRHVIGMISSGILIQPGQQGEFTSRFYVGPKEQGVLEGLSEGLDLSVDYSWLTIIAKPIFWLMTFIHDNIVSNWGWSIILLTLFIKLLFFKLSEYGYRSMANIRLIQPKMVSLQERYGQDKQRLRQAMMELYRKEKINPMSGCFPILVQIPVFIALYWVLLESVELRQAPFIFWIDDLATKDPYFVLPIIMGVTMVLQQKLNPAPMDEMQKTIMKVLPVVFTIFFLFFPSGLVLYWVVNNILSIAQQWVIIRRIERRQGKPTR